MKLTRAAETRKVYLHLIPYLIPLSYTCFSYCCAGSRYIVTFKQFLTMYQIYVCHILCETIIQKPAALFTFVFIEIKQSGLCMWNS
jgi:hypothetical protein